MERYNRHIILPEIGMDGQQKLIHSKVLVIGAGGLGSPVLIYLAAAGIGTIGIVDNDVVSLSNLQRQILYQHQEVGLSKVEQAKQRLINLNPDIKIHTYNTIFSDKNALEIAEGYDMIVDCTDNYASRYLIDDISQQLNIPMIYGSISKFTGQVAIFNYQGSKSYRDLFAEPPKEDMSDPSRLGVIGTLPGIVGSIQANEVVKLILGFQDNLVQKLFLIDTRTMATNVVAF